jgi:hypothetical protein
METEPCCEYCGREVVAERANDHGRMEQLCEQCMADFARGDELNDRYAREYDEDMSR